MPKKKPKRRKKPISKKAVRRKTVRKKAAAKKTARKKPARKRKSRRRKLPVRGKRQGATIAAVEERGLGPEAGGQAGDAQGLAHFPGADSESVEELAAEGQAFEADVVSGVENAPDADVAEVTTKEVPEDDVPPEYQGSE
ncbi:MAG TPA: hypothetical protein VG204_01515 [Terriglobia bacterium]|nr:hypothetical protein [Terriglobia bacterium]